MPTQYRARFFSEISYSSMTSSIVKNPTLLHELIQQIKFFKDSFEEQLKRPSTPKDAKELEGAIRRSEQRLDTLRKLEAKKPVTAQEKKLLVDYIKTMYISGAKVFADLHKESDLQEEKSQNPSV